MNTKYLSPTLILHLSFREDFGHKGKLVKLKPAMQTHRQDRDEYSIFVKGKETDIRSHSSIKDRFVLLQIHASRVKQKVQTCPGSFSHRTV